MRIANKLSLSAVAHFSRAAFIAAMIFAPLASAHAQNAAMTPPPLPAVLMPQPIVANGDISKNVATLEDKATDSAKDLVKTLDNNDALTLEDLNHARQTVSRIDAMIEIEKRLNELEKLRNARAGASNNVPANFANAIPASALSPPPAKFIPSTLEVPAAAIQQDMSGGMHDFGGLDISRITGSDGKYTAMLKTGDGSVHVVRVGDELNGSTVRWITSSAVALEHKGKTRILHVKNVDIVTSALR